MHKIVSESQLTILYTPGQLNMNSTHLMS